MAATPSSPDQAPARRRRRALFTPGPDLLLPRGLHGVPAAIVDANEVAIAAVEQIADARRRAGAARDQAKAAERFDQLTAQAAVAAGEDAPTTTAPAKAQAAADADAAARATEQVARERISDLYDAVDHDFEAYLASRETAVEQLAGPLRATIATLVEQLEQLCNEMATAGAARTWHNNPASAALTGGGPGEGLGRKNFERARERQGKVTALNRRSQLVHNAVPELLAALALGIEDHLTDAATTPRAPGETSAHREARHNRPRPYEPH